MTKMASAAALLVASRAFTLATADPQTTSEPRISAPRATPSATPRPSENRTQVQVSSVDVSAATLTFVDAEGETNTWKLDPPALAKSPLLQPGARVTIAWRSDEKGTPITTILAVAPIPSPRPSASPSASVAAPADGVVTSRPRPPTKPTPTPKP